MIIFNVLNKIRLLKTVKTKIHNDKETMLKHAQIAGLSLTKKFCCWFYIWGIIEQATLRLTHSILHLSFKSLLLSVFLFCSKNLCVTILLADDMF